MEMRHSTRRMIRRVATTALALALSIGVVAFVRTAIERAEYNNSLIPTGYEVYGSPPLTAKTVKLIPDYDGDLGVEAILVLLCAGSLVWILAPRKKKSRLDLRG